MIICFACLDTILFYVKIKVLKTWFNFEINYYFLLGSITCLFSTPLNWKLYPQSGHLDMGGVQLEPGKPMETCFKVRSSTPLCHGWEASLWHWQSVATLWTPIILVIKALVQMLVHWSLCLWYIQNNIFHKDMDICRPAREARGTCFICELISTKVISTHVAISGKMPQQCLFTRVLRINSKMKTRHITV